MNVAPTHRNVEGRRRVAVVGSGISGASAAWALSGSADVVLFEQDHRLGGHTATVDIDYVGRPVSVDTGFIVYNEHNYTNLTALFDHLGVATHASNMGFSMSLDGGRLEWSGENLSTIFAQWRNLVSPKFLWMLREILRFNSLCVADRDNGVASACTIGEYLEHRNFSSAFRDDYLIPMASAIWSTPKLKMMDYPAATFISFFENHRLINNERPVWRTVTGGARNYLDKLLAPLPADAVRKGERVHTVLRDAFGATVWAGRSAPEHFDAVILAGHPNQSLEMLGDASLAEQAILSAIQYRPNRVMLHRDPALMPKRKAAWAAWNYLRDSRDDSEVCVTYWMNRLQGIDANMPLFVSLNPAIEPREDLVFGEWSYDHPQFDARALAAQMRMDEIQGVRNTWYAGAWNGHGFHEDGLKSGLAAAEALGAQIPWRPHRVAAPVMQPAIAAE